MFTGIVTAVGTIAAAEDRGEVKRFSILSPYDPPSLAIGASVACAGICLTVTSRQASGAGVAFQVDVGPETLGLTTAASWRIGARLNLERALKIGDELGGHLVSGHIDGLATVLDRADLGATVRFELDAPEPLHRFVAAKGSVALDGVSLTVNRVQGRRFSVHLIPHTLTLTTFTERRPGDRLNLEVDLLARYAARLAETA